MPKRAQLTEAEREQRRAADRAFVQQAVDALRSSQGWQRWPRAGTSTPTRSLSRGARVNDAVMLRWDGGDMSLMEASRPTVPQV